MDLSLGSKLKAGITGAAVIGALVLIGGVLGPALIRASVASEPAIIRQAIAPLAPSPGKALDTHLAKFDGDYFAIGTETGVSLTPESDVEVRKIGYGRTSFVDVMHTASGTYSTDGLHSPYIRYPGIHVVPVDLRISPFGVVLGWSKLTGWTRISLLSANSIGFLDDDSVPASRDGVCVTDTEIGGCR